MEASTDTHLRNERRDTGPDEPVCGPFHLHHPHVDIFHDEREGVDERCDI
jgi:hypothetical protein